MTHRRNIPVTHMQWDPETGTFKLDPAKAVPPPRRCWFHRWRHLGFIGIAFLVEHQQCEKCGKERCVQVVP